MVDRLLVLVIEEIDLEPGNSKIVTSCKQFAASLRITQVARMHPQEQAHALLTRIVGKLAKLIVAESSPEPFEDVVLEPELTSPSAPAFCLIECHLRAH